MNLSGQSQRWHSECFRCQVCNQALDREESCHVLKDKIICRDDYAKLQQEEIGRNIRCSRCDLPIAANDWVRKAGNYIYHIACFSCDICSRQLSTGEQFTLNVIAEEKNSVRLLCRLHFAIDSDQDSSLSPRQSINYATSSVEKQLKRNHQTAKYSEMIASTSNSSLTMASSNAPRLPIFESLTEFLNDSSSMQQHQHELMSATINQTFIKSGHASHHHLPVPPHQSHGLQHHNLESLRVNPNNHSTSDSSTSSSTSSPSSGKQQQMIMGGTGLGSKSKRVRTTFTEEQLTLLQAQFQRDSNPDGQDLERIATVTGLSKRVTQVWFQNSRARQKKYMVKRKPSLSANNSAATCVVATVNSGNVDNQQQLSSSDYHQMSEFQNQNNRLKHDRQLTDAQAMRKWSSERPDFSFTGSSNITRVNFGLDQDDGGRSSATSDGDHLMISDNEETSADEQNGDEDD